MASMTTLKRSNIWIADSVASNHVTFSDKGCQSKRDVAGSKHGNVGKSVLAKCDLDIPCVHFVNIGNQVPLKNKFGIWQYKFPLQIKLILYNTQYILKFHNFNVLLTKKLYSSTKFLHVRQKLNEIKKKHSLRRKKSFLV